VAFKTMLECTAQSDRYSIAFIFASEVVFEAKLEGDQAGQLGFIGGTGAGDPAFDLGRGDFEQDHPRLAHIGDYDAAGLAQTQGTAHIFAQKCRLERQYVGLETRHQLLHLLL